jgi:RNA polymerase sigma-70 factor (ECF subfamily)
METALSDYTIGSPEQWLHDHGGALYRFALVRLRDEHKAEEAVQDTLVAALQAQARFTGGASVRTWLTGILKHKIMDQFRREAREVPMEDSSAPLADCAVCADDELFDAEGSWRERLSDWGNPEDMLERSELMVILQRCLDALPERLARLFMLREVMEETTESICQELSITPTNVWTMLYRARMGLRQCLDQNGAGRARG